ncbi:MBL fold metallo-hydrolase [Piscinibacter sp. XHJ-5]|uniref:MBL fold metallo-hydrolase n=1 Tax=Piscinibacter sp. XHJ-5 TaxID=3037797 RepID=UPI002453494B|nr:MBL fold metallo-hydrolase [Piscinibacter sp. XHJ-5]
MIPLRRFGRFWVAAVLFALMAVAAPRADTVNTRELQVRELARGVYTIRHPDPTDDFPDGNTTVVIGERSVLVIDTGYLPSTADADIARIRRWTDKPVRWVLNTHWHNDHVGGNQRYRLAWPGAEVVGHEETRRMIDARVRSYVRRFVAPDSTFARQRETLRRTAETGVDAQGKPVDAAARQAAAASLARLERALAEFRDIVLEPPTLTFETGLRIDLGGRVVELKHLGRGNTGGDVVAWLPAERILVAGDLVDHPVPYAFGGYPTEWIATLDRLAALDPAVIVPGHGDPLQGKGYIERVAGLLRGIRQQVNDLVERHGGTFTLEEVQKAIDLTEARRLFAGDDADNREFFDASMAGLIRSAYAEARAR